MTVKNENIDKLKYARHLFHFRTNFEVKCLFPQITNFLLTLEKLLALERPLSSSPMTLMRERSTGMV